LRWGGAGAQGLARFQDFSSSLKLFGKASGGFLDFFWVLLLPHPRALSILARFFLRFLAFSCAILGPILGTKNGSCFWNPFRVPSYKVKRATQEGAQKWAPKSGPKMDPKIWTSAEKHKKVERKLSPKTGIETQEKGLHSCWGLQSSRQIFLVAMGSQVAVWLQQCTAC